ncbi:MAG TPA: hypothetical protein PKE69_25445, partial [Pyrinomonadaceae bacterium]|nr:hypothetical protein [Pyrinomonadaceae bacterium]
IVRFNADGTIDTSFNPPALVKSGNNSDLLQITALALQTDGKILIGGNFTTFGTVRRSYLARLNTDGSLDISFNANYGGAVGDIEISADGKITVCSFTSANVRRFFSDGTLDTSFTPQINTSSTGVLDIFVQTDGKTLVAVRNTNGTSNLYRFNANGSIDFSHLLNGSSYVINRIVVQPDGKILLGGSFTQIDGFPVPQGLLRLNPDGMVDTTFNITNSGVSGSVNDIELLANGKILIGGSFGSYNGTSRQYLAMINSDGSLDNSFNYTPGRVLGVYDLAVQTDGKIVVGTYTDFSQSNLVPPIARLNADATLDSSIQPFMGSAGFVNKVLVQPDGKILVAGFYNQVNSLFRRNFSRFNLDGTYDASFVNSIFFSDPLSSVRNLDMQPDGKILVSGGFGDGERVNPDGSHDVTVRLGTGNLYDLPDGKLIGLTDRIQRFSANGGIETEPTRFNFGGAPRRAVILPDGKIIVVGTFTEVNFSAPRGRIARLNADTTFDTTFDPPGDEANNAINDVALQSDGKIIVGGDFTSFNGNSNYKYLARLNADGTLDTSFNPVLNGSVTCLKLQ